MRSRPRKPSSPNGWVETVSSEEDTQNLRESMTQYNQFVNRFGTAGLLWFGASMVLDGQLTLGQLVAVNLLNMRFSQPMMRLCLFAYDFSRLRGLVKELGTVLNEPTERQSGHLVPGFLPSKALSVSRTCVSATRAEAGTLWTASRSRSSPGGNRRHRRSVGFG